MFTEYALEFREKSLLELLSWWLSVCSQWETLTCLNVTYPGIVLFCKTTYKRLTNLFRPANKHKSFSA